MAFILIALSVLLYWMAYSTRKTWVALCSAGVGMSTFLWAGTLLVGPNGTL